MSIDKVEINGHNFKICINSDKLATFKFSKKPLEL